MTLTPEQFNRCACECMAWMTNAYDEPADLEHNAHQAIAAAEALSKALAKSKQAIGPMDAKRRKS